MLYSSTQISDPASFLICLTKKCRGRFHSNVHSNITLCSFSECLSVCVCLLRLYTFSLWRNPSLSVSRQLFRGLRDCFFVLSSMIICMSLLHHMSSAPGDCLSLVCHRQLTPIQSHGPNTCSKEYFLYVDTFVSWISIILFFYFFLFTKGGFCVFRYLKGHYRLFPRYGKSLTWSNLWFSRYTSAVAPTPFPGTNQYNFLTVYIFILNVLNVVFIDNTYMKAPSLSPIKTIPSAKRITGIISPSIFIPILSLAGLDINILIIFPFRTLLIKIYWLLYGYLG